MSRTMRIDLIPDAPRVPVKQGRRVVVNSSSTTGEIAAVAEDSASSQAGMSRYHELLDSIYDAAVITDLNGNVRETNARAVQFLQWSKQDLAKLCISDIISGTDETLMASLCQNLENKRFMLIQAHCVRKDGTYFSSEIAVNRLRSGEGSLCFFIRDITVRRQAEEML
ncbi:MAG TPA: hypothetical protein DCS43_04750, partial [Verrucomicrobia bacterium]|nr:hypothetical protein [Verrucomicrobiota bacterium]